MGLEGWCEKTFGWFEEKTKPKCLQNCVAKLCKPRCEVNDKLRDLQDEEAAYLFKMNQTLKAEEALNESRAELEDLIQKRDDLKIECNEIAKKQIEIKDKESEDAGQAEKVEIQGEMSKAEA